MHVDVEYVLCIHKYHTSTQLSSYSNTYTKKKITISPNQTRMSLSQTTSYQKKKTKMICSGCTFCVGLENGSALGAGAVVVGARGSVGVVCVEVNACAGVNACEEVSFYLHVIFDDLEVDSSSVVAVANDGNRADAYENLVP